MLKKISHVGVAVKDLNAAEAIYARLTGKPCEGREEVEQQHVRLAFFHVGDFSIELTQATAPDSPIAKFIEKHGEGIHHLSFEVEDIRAELARLKQAGFQLIDEEPRIGAGGCHIAFIHPKSTGGILVELSQKRTS